MSELDLDPRERRFVLPTRVVWQSGGTTVENTDCLLHNDTGQATLYAPALCTLRRAKRSRTPTGILLDFGQELNGGVQIVVGASQPPTTRVRIRFGESVSEAMGEPNNDHANHDLIFPLQRWGTQEIGNTGFRFVRIDLADPDSEVRLIAVRAVSLLRPLPYLGQFHSSDERLNEIWRVGARTVHLCLQDHVWDGIKRDRLVWIGDMHPETQVVSAVFGQLPIVPASLDYVRDQTPLTGKSFWMNGISSYSLWWLLIQDEWFRRWGDRTYLSAQRDYLTGLVRLLTSYIGENGAETLDGMRFLDWPSSPNAAATHAGLHALLLMALRAGVHLLEHLNETGVAEDAFRAADRAARYVPPIDPTSKQASSLLALAGLQPADRVNQEALSVEPLRGVSTFYGYYVLQARALAGDYTGALEVIRRYWEAPREEGATSFWEDFDLAWAENAARIDEITPPGKIDLHRTYGAFCYKGLRHSLCHGWAAGPTAWLSEHVLGVRFFEMGNTITLQPHLGDLTEAEGVVPTACGPLHVRHRRTSSGEVKSDVDLPSGLTVLSH